MPKVEDYNAVLTLYHALAKQKAERVIVERRIEKIVLEIETLLAFLKDETVPSRPWFIYAIRAGETSYFKLGITVDLKQRMDELQIGNAEVLAIYKFSPPIATKPEAHILESELHRKLSNYYVRGEWYRLDAPRFLGELIDDPCNMIDNKKAIALQMPNTGIIRVIEHPDCY